jgi:mRNA-degrading endonuclease toxin of MazEF toxin-antitoxin module
MRNNLQTVAKHKLGPYISHLSGAKMRELRAALEFALDIEGMR